MKKQVLILAVTLSAAGAFAAGTIRENCGCGLGTMALGEQEPTVLSQVAATFLNGICGNQTFGITSGTLECEPHAGIASNAHVKEYIAANMDQVILDVAAGRGESLNALADLMEVPTAERAQLYAKLQSSFDVIFPSSVVTSTDVVSNMDKVING
ncbi:MAG: DUF3015 family protein [Verrucomicrobia bacterium]|nr:DUF3015 family protein [Verrucomicrobiota bacterium]